MSNDTKCGPENCPVINWGGLSPDEQRTVAPVKNARALLPQRRFLRESRHRQIWAVTGRRSMDSSRDGV